MEQNNNLAGSVDFGIVTALPVELHAILEQLDNQAEPIQEGTETYTYYRGQIINPKTGKHYEVAVVKMLESGNLEALTAAISLIHRWQPSHVLMVGIAAGAADKVNLGDVVIAKSIYYYELGKHTAGELIVRPQQESSNRQLYDRATSYNSSSWIEKINKPRPTTPADKSPIPTVHSGVIASGEKVISDEDVFTRLRKQQSQVIAIAMEGYGVLRAVTRQPKSLGFIEIRGISDFGDSTKNDNWQPYAASAAAAYTISFLRECGLPLVRSNNATRQLSYLQSDQQTPPTTQTPITNEKTGVQKSEPIKINDDIEQKVNQRINSTFQPRQSNGFGPSSLQIVWAILYNEEVIDPVEFMDQTFVNKIAGMARAGEPGLLDNLAEIKPPKVTTNSLTLVQELGRDVGDGQTTLILYKDGTLSISFTGLHKPSGDITSFTTSYIDPEQVQYRLEQAWGFANRWWTEQDPLYKQNPLLFNIALYNVEHKRFDKTPPHSVNSFSPPNNKFPDPLVIYEAPKQSTRNEMQKPIDLIKHSIKQINLLFNKKP